MDKNIQAALEKMALTDSGPWCQDWHGMPDRALIEDAFLGGLCGFARDFYFRICMVSVK
jgi:hypothetical protein